MRHTRISDAVEETASPECDDATMGKQSAKLSAAIRPILAGYPAPVQSAALADLVSIWLAGHFIEGMTEAELRAFHADLFDNFRDCVFGLLPISIEEVSELRPQTEEAVR